MTPLSLPSLLVLAPLCQALSPQPLGLTLEHQRLARAAGLGGRDQLQDGHVRNHIQGPFLRGLGAAEDRTVEEISGNILQEAVEVQSNLANKFNDLSSIHFSTPQFSYVPPFLKNVVQTKKSKFDELIDLKKSTLDKLTDPSRYLKALENIVEFKKSALDTIIHPNKANIEKIINFKKSALGNIIHPKKELIADLVQKKREKIAELGATFPSALGNIIHPKKELIADLVQQKREKIAEIGASFPGSEKLRQRLFPGSERLRATLLQPFKQAYQGFRDGVREDIGSLPRPGGPPPTSSASFSPSPQGSVPWQLAGNTFRPISAPATSKPQRFSNIEMRAKTTGCPYAIQYCQDSISSRLPKATAMLAEEPQEEPQKEVREGVQERVVKSSMRVVAADSPSQRRPRQGYQQTRRPRQPTPLLRQKKQDKLVASRPSRRPKAPARLQGLPEGFRGALRIPKESTPINRAVHASSIFLNIDEFMASLRRRGLPTESLLTPNTIPIRGVEQKKTEVLRGRLKKQDESMLPRMRVLPTPIVAAEEDINEFSFVSSDQRRIDTEPFDDILTQESSGYGDKILLDKKQDLDVSASDNVFTKDDLELVAGLVKPLVAELKAGLTTTTDQPVGEQNNNVEIDTTTAMPSEHSEETTNDISMTITDYYGSDQEKVIGDYSNKIQLNDAENIQEVKDSLDEILESDDSGESSKVIHKLPENIAVMSLVRETPEILEEKREDLPVFMAMVQEQKVEVEQEVQVEVEKEDEEQEEVFYLPAGHGLRFSFKRGNLGKLRPGRGLGIF